MLKAYEKGKSSKRGEGASSRLHMFRHPWKICISLPFNVQSIPVNPSSQSHFSSLQLPLLLHEAALEQVNPGQVSPFPSITVAPGQVLQLPPSQS